MAAEQSDSSWMWNPLYEERQCDTAGVFVHFRRHFVLNKLPTEPWVIQLSADTKYKLYVNHQLVAIGPVKGDESLWFFDEIDISPYLLLGDNCIGIHVLRFFYASTFAPSFPRTPYGGVMIKSQPPIAYSDINLASSTLWETAINKSIILPLDITEDDFLHVYERTADTLTDLEWVAAKLHHFQISTGHSPPWKLQKRMIPISENAVGSVHELHNIKSCLPEQSWVKLLKSQEGITEHPKQELLLPAGTKHSLEVEVENHTTAYLRFRFQRFKSQGSTLKITYSESYEDPPTLVPYLRVKNHRRDFSKALHGPWDLYTLRGSIEDSVLGYHESENMEEILAPFHFRTFRFLKIEIDVGDYDLQFNGMDIICVNYPLEIVAELIPPVTSDGTLIRKIWENSVRTLKNCMHDCYEDCPFYEQLQYAMDTRNSILFTYYVSGDDRLARQAIVQLFNSFRPQDGLTASRAPSHTRQLIPHFSLFWIMMLHDHLTYFNDKVWLQQFMSVVDGVLQYFHGHIDPKLGLVKLDTSPGIWNFVDWTEPWRPYGIPPAAERTGYSTYTNCLYAHTLRLAASMLRTIERHGLAAEYEVRAEQIIWSINAYCFDGSSYTDGLAKGAQGATDYSQHSQFWAVLCGAISGLAAQNLLVRTLSPCSTAKFIRPSMAMSFFALRAASKAGGDIYDTMFSSFWSPWKTQIELGLTTWEEDHVSQRSDCHAWGCVPIFEYLAEVAGVSPGADGWDTVRFQPRVKLFPKFEVTVPCGKSQNGMQRLARVAWEEISKGLVDVSLSLSTEEDAELFIYISLPGQLEFIWNGAKGLRFTATVTV